jgi:transglutaminase-like putative cysteine protease
VSPVHDRRRNDFSSPRTPGAARLGARELALGALLGAAIALVRAPQETQQVAAERMSIWPLAGLAALALGALGVSIRRWTRHKGGEALAVLLLVYVLPCFAGLGALSVVLTRAAIYAPALFVLGGVLALVHRRQAISLALWLALACAVSVHAVAPSTSTWFAFLAVAACCGAGLVVEHRDATVRRFLRRRVTAGRTRPGFESAHSTPARAMLVGLAVASLAWMLTGSVQRAYARALDQAHVERRAAHPQDPSQRSAEGALRQWLSSVSMGSSAAQRSDELVATVALRDGRNGEPLRLAEPPYFPVTTLDALNGDRLESSGLDGSSSLRDADDGEQDGWIELRRPAPRAPLTTATVAQFTQGSARGGWLPLLRLEPLHAVRLGEVRRLGDGALLLEAPGAKVEYALVAASREPRLAEGETARARHPEARFLAAPRDEAAFERIADEARRIASGRSSDAERVLAIVEHFREGFSYSEEGMGAEGLEGIVRLLDRRAGYCSSIAAAAVVMLRSLDIPSRAVAGFLGSEYDLERDEYVLRQRHGHAWIEAHFEGLGWVRFEPTPADRRAPAALGERGPGTLSSWSSALQRDVGALFSGADDAPTMGDVAARLADGPKALLEAAKKREPVALGLLLALAFAAALAVFRAVRNTLRGVRVARSPEGRALAFEQRLIDALRRRGAQVSPSRTLREIVRSAEARVERPLAKRLELAVRALYAVRFGGEELEVETRREVEAVIAELRADPAAPAI